ncbi:MAG: hypothetical protein A3C36_02770 [Omnitrophica WOR_2 bacterium RIFCSPHIGHO2_02_FULL_52_10]|nr:MAG: hypothetical protein A3C36_02770 [Omnitrophica WOR_2 bacterium RIFCSPHIGHO2_02_FULL_52_10]
MKKFTLVMAVVSAGFFVFTAGLRAQNFQEGKWSMTMVTTMEGMDQESNEAMAEMENMSPEEKAMMQQMMGGMNVQMGGNGAGITTTVTKCLSAQDPVPGMSEDEDCQQTHSVNGNTIHFEEACSDSHSTGQVTYNGDTMSGTITSRETVDGQETSATIEINGQYVGPCS